MLHCESNIAPLTAYPVNEATALVHPYRGGPKRPRLFRKTARGTVAGLRILDEERKDMSFKIQRLNHAVLYVRDARRAAKFYQDVLGFVVRAQMGDRAVFLCTNDTTSNNHDLGLFSIDPSAPGPTRGERVGLYHLAWQVDNLPELAEVRDRLIEANALVGVNDHGSSLSLYAHDPDGNEFEVFWQVPEEEWATRKGGMLDIEGEMAKRGLTAAPA